MGSIHLLDTALANQIAAGEVVERPASVVKELVENAVDARATSIRVKIDDGGVALIEVLDDGVGMDREDAALSVQRHATSKLTRFDDLASLSTLGFRGEALPSIASVSRLQIRTRRAESDEGTLVTVEGGSAPEVRPTGCPVGTSVRVEELFFNVPARRKFLKSAATENGHVASVLRRLSLARPDLRIQLERDGRRALEFLPASGAHARLRELHPGDVFTEVQGGQGDLLVQAWLGQGAKAKRGSARLYLFVNGRAVQDRILARAVASAYGDSLAAGAYPGGAVFIDIAAHRVDVNVHPQKSEVRFADADRVMRDITGFLTTGLFRAGRLGKAGTSGTSSGATSGTPAMPMRQLSRSRSFWDDRLGLGPLKDGAKVGTATVHKQGTHRSREPRASPASTIEKDLVTRRDVETTDGVAENTSFAPPVGATFSTRRPPHRSPSVSATPPEPALLGRGDSGEGSAGRVTAAPGVREPARPTRESPADALLAEAPVPPVEKPARAAPSAAERRAREIAQRLLTVVAGELRESGMLEAAAAVEAKALALSED